MKLEIDAPQAYIISVDALKQLLEYLKLRKNSVRFKELEKILLQLGFEVRRSKRGTSHRVFSHPKLTQNIVLVSHGKNDSVKIYQVHDVLKALQELDNNNEKKS
jgi:predicted RNA binding protein YcfA (HicA-like mRNA interferase family)